MNMLQLTNSFTESALRAAKMLQPGAISGIPIPEMNGFFIIQKGRKPNGDKIVATLRDEETGNEYDVYVPVEGHA